MCQMPKTHHEKIDTMSALPHMLSFDIDQGNNTLSTFAEN